MAKRGRPRKAVVHLEASKVRVSTKYVGGCYLYYGSRIDGKQNTSSSVGISPSSWATEEEAKQHAAAFLAMLSKKTEITILNAKQTAMLAPQIAQIDSMLQQQAQSPAQTQQKQQPPGQSPAVSTLQSRVAPCNYEKDRKKRRRIIAAAKKKAAYDAWERQTKADIIRQTKKLDKLRVRVDLKGVIDSYSDGSSSGDDDDVIDSTSLRDVLGSLPMFVEEKSRVVKLIEERCDRFGNNMGTGAYSALSTTASAQATA